MYKDTEKRRKKDEGNEKTNIGKRTYSKDTQKKKENVHGQTKTYKQNGQ